MKGKYIIILFFGFITFHLITTIMNAKRVMLSSYHFIIQDIDTTGKGGLIFYTEGAQVNFYPFWVTQVDSILIGDSIAKDSCDIWLRFYRLDKNNEMVLFSEHEPVMLFSNLFCD